jgi:hypothetical protein
MSMLSAVNAVNLVNTVNAVKMLPPSGGVLSQVSLPFLLSSFSYQLFVQCRGDKIRTCGLYVPNVAL